jgi:predicted transcriptional regulator
MNIREIIDTLEEIAEINGNDTEVRLMTQEHWPFENSIRHIRTSDELPGEYEDELSNIKFEQEELSAKGKDLTDEDQEYLDALREREDDLLEKEEQKPVIAYLVEGSQICYGNKDAFLS